jgi:hypothetical protein
MQHLLDASVVPVLVDMDPLECQGRLPLSVVLVERPSGGQAERPIPKKSSNEPSRRRFSRRSAIAGFVACAPDYVKGWASATSVVGFDVLTMLDARSPVAHRARPTRPSATFLHRDGLIVEDVDAVLRADQLTLTPGAAETVSRARASRGAVVVVTNQPVVARGLVDHDGVRVPVSDVAFAPVPAGSAVELPVRRVGRWLSGRTQASASREMTYEAAARHLAGAVALRAEQLQPRCHAPAALSFVPRHPTLDSARVVELELSVPPPALALDQLASG